MKLTLWAILIIFCLAFYLILFREPISNWYHRSEARLDREYDEGREPLPSDYAVYKGELVKLDDYGRCLPKLNVASTPIPVVVSRDLPKQNFVPKNRRLERT
jgi:hypothetical protein